MTTKILSAVVGVVGAGALATSVSKGITLGEELRRDLGLEVGVVELRHVAESKDPVIAVPLAAIIEETKTFVYLREGVTDTFLKQEVEVGVRGSEYVELLSGVFPGDSIVVKNGDKIGLETKKTPGEAVADLETDGKKGEERSGGFVDRSKTDQVESKVEDKAEVVEERPGKDGAVAKGGSGEKSSKECPTCGKESVTPKGFCQNGYCEVPRAARAYTAPRCDYGGGCESGYGRGLGGCDFGPSYHGPSCSW